MKRLAATLLSAVFAVPVLSAPRAMTFAGFNGASLDRTEFKSIEFSYKDDDEIAFYGAVPQHSDTSGRLNTCANVAGAMVLGYYDKVYDSMIENFTSTRVIMGHVIYTPQTERTVAAGGRLSAVD